MLKGLQIHCQFWLMLVIYTTYSKDTEQGMAWVTERRGWDCIVHCIVCIFYEALSAFTSTWHLLSEQRILRIELFTENGTVFKMAQKTFNIKWRKVPVALGSQFSVDSRAGHTLNFQSTKSEDLNSAILCFSPIKNALFSANSSKKQNRYQYKVGAESDWIQCYHECD